MKKVKCKKCETEFEMFDNFIGSIFCENCEENGNYQEEISKIIFEKYKNRKWEDLNEKEKAEWDNFVEKNQNSIKKIKILSEMKKCFICKAKFPEGILNKNPYKILPFLNMIKADFLFHLKSTHGIEPEIFEKFIIYGQIEINKLNENIL